MPFDIPGEGKPAPKPPNYLPGENPKFKAPVTLHPVVQDPAFEQAIQKRIAANQGKTFIAPVMPVGERANAQQQAPPQPYVQGQPGEPPVAGVFDKPLPYGAVGFDHNGRPYYGGTNAISEWWLGAKARITAPVGDTPPLDLALFKAPSEEGGFLNPQNWAEALGALVHDVNIFAARASNLGVEEGGNPGIFNYIGRSATEFIGGVMAVTLEGAKEAEQTLGALHGANVRGGEASLDSPLPAADPAFVSQVSQVALGRIGVGIWNTVRYAFSRTPAAEKASNAEKDYQAGRVFYSSIGQETVRQEYLRRYAANENPYLLAQELENPIIEAIGQIILDPFILYTAVTKAKKVTRLIGTAEKEWSVVPKAIEEALGTMKSENSIVDGLEAITKAQMEHAAQIERGVQETATNTSFLKSLFGHDASGKASIAAERATDMWRQTYSEILKGGGDAHDFMEIMLGHVESVSKDAVQANYGIERLLGAVRDGKILSARRFFSDEGTEVAVIMHNMLADEKGIFKIEEFINKASKLENIEAAAKWADELITKSTKKMFPSILERLALDPIANPTEFEAAMRHIPPWLATAARADARMAPVWGWVNNKLGWLFMGKNPGYAHKNLYNNTLTIGVDQGKGVFAHTGETWMEISKKWLGWDSSGIKVGLGGGPAAGVKGLVINPSETLGKAYLSTDMMKVAQKFEENGAMKVVGYSVDRTMRTTLPKILDIAPLTEAGIPEVAARYIVGEIAENYGDIDLVLAKFLEEAKTGSVSVLGSGSGMSSKLKKQLLDYHVSPQVSEAIKSAKTEEDLLSKLDDIFRPFDEEAAKVVGDITVLDPAVDEGAKVIDTLREAAVQGTFNKDNLAVATNQIGANSNSNRAWAKALEDAQKQALHEAALAGDTSKVEQVLKTPIEIPGLPKKYTYLSLTDNTLYIDLNAVSDAEMASTNAVKDLVMSKKWSESELAKLWIDTGIPGEPPAGLNQSKFLNALWGDHYYPKQTEFWAGHRNLFAKYAEDGIKELAKVSNVDEASAAVKTAQTQLARALKFDTFAKDRKVYQNLQLLLKADVPNNARIARAYADVYNLAPVEAYVKEGDQYLLNIINKHNPLGATYKSLAEVPKEISAHTLLSYALGEGVQLPSGLAAMKTKLAAYLDTGTFDKELWDFVKKNASADEFQLITDLRGNMKASSSAAKAGGDPILQKIANADKKSFEIAVTQVLDKTEGVKAVKTAQQMAGKADEFLQASNKLTEEAALLSKRLNAGDITKEQWWDEMKNLYKDDPEFLQQLGKETGYIEEVKIPAPTIDPKAVPYNGNAAPTAARYYHETTEARHGMLDDLKKYVTDNWGKRQPVYVDTGVTATLKGWAKGMSARIADAKLVASRVAAAERDFALHSYRKRGFDRVMSYIFPYQYWYTRTYAKWMSRITTNLDAVTAYSIYKDTLSKIHADLPEWWKYQINTNELLGMDSEHPLYFNLEASMNPLYGLLGPDFNDPVKRVNTITTILDQIDNFGPSIWTPVNMAIAFALYKQGNDDAAARWGGRLVPQTATIKAATSILGIGPPGGVELDPAVILFSGGMGVYEARRVGRALGSMVESGQISQAQADEIARTKNGPIWDQAVRNASMARAPGQVASFIFGVGFKARDVTDVSIDRFYEDYYRLWDMMPNLSPDEARQSMDWLRATYPFMDPVLLSRKAGYARDRSYAYSVLSRIPPGQKDDLMKLAGIDSDLFGKFYETKGDIESWSEGDRSRFIGAVVDIGAVLEMPDYPTQQAWTAASSAYSEMNKAIEKAFGSDIMVKIDAFYQTLSDNPNSPDAAQNYMDRNPDVQDAMDFRTQYILNHSKLAPYYTSMKSVERLYSDQMYDAIEKSVGKDIWDKWDKYYELKDTGDTKGASAYYKENKATFDKYFELRDAYRKKIAERIVNIHNMLPVGEPATIRADVVPEELPSTQKKVYETVTNPQEKFYSWTWQDWQQQVSPSLEGLIVDYFNGDDFSDAAFTSLSKVADKLGIDTDLMLSLMENSR